MYRASFLTGRIVPLLACALVNAACSASEPVNADASSDAPRPDAGVVQRQLRYPPAACPGSSDEAPIPDGLGGHVCTYVGANRAVATGAWPDLRSEIGPFVYVRVGAVNGDGTAAMPFATLAEAVASPLPKRTIVLGPGRYESGTSPVFSGAITIVGTGGGGANASGRGGGGADSGTDASTDSSADGGADDGSASDGGGPVDASSDTGASDGSVDAALDVTGDAGPSEATGTTIVAHDGIGLSVDGSSANVTVRRLEITADGTSVSIGARVTSAGLLTLDNVSITNVDIGISVSGSSLRASGLTIRDTQIAALSLTSGSSAVLNGIQFRHGSGAGIIADASTLSITEGLIVDYSGGGVILRGPSPSGMDHLDRVVVSGNSLVGIGAVNSAGVPPVERTVEFALVSVSDTHANGSLGSGYGIFIGSGIEAQFDLSIVSDARRGFGSDLQANERAGLVVSGSTARLELHGGRVSSNSGPGLMLQHGATGGTVGYSEFNDNDGVGSMITSDATLAYFLCDEDAENHLAPIAFTSRNATIGDGLLVATTDAMASNLTLNGNHFRDNDRFGAFLAAGRLFVGGSNIAERNGTGNGRTATAVITGMSNFLPESANPPASSDLPVVTDALPEPAL